jgi:hypothetical protein
MTLPDGIPGRELRRRRSRVSEVYLTRKLQTIVRFGSIHSDGASTDRE